MILSAIKHLTFIYSLKYHFESICLSLKQVNNYQAIGLQELCVDHMLMRCPEIHELIACEKLCSHQAESMYRNIITVTELVINISLFSKIMFHYSVMFNYSVQTMSLEDNKFKRHKVKE